MLFYIEFEVLPFRAIQTASIRADSESKALRYLKKEFPNAKLKIRKVENYHFGY